MKEKPKKIGNALKLYIYALLMHVHLLLQTPNAAIRQSSVAQTLKASVEQECHVTLSKNMQSGELYID